MTEVILELYAALEQLRETLSNIDLSPQMRSKIDDLVKPVFENEISRQRVTDIINAVGDFSENVLVPLLEQYVSANVALRVKFLIEDVLVFVESYRDDMVKKIEKEAKKKTQTQSVAQGKKGRRLAVNSVTSAYRAALFGKPRHVPSRYAGTVRTHPGRLPSSRMNSVNTGKTAIYNVKQNTSYRATLKGRKTTSSDKTALMTTINIDKTAKSLKNTVNTKRPSPSQSGQVLVKIMSVGLNSSDLPGQLEGNSGDEAEPPHVTQLKALSKSLVNFATGSGSLNKRGGKKDSNSKTNIIGQEFCGMLLDIAWQRGDFLHRMHVAKGDLVYGVLSAGRGALGEYVVCDVNDVSRLPGRLSSDHLRGAKLGIDGGVVCRTLASTDITNPRGTNILVVGGGTNKGMILIELLTNDLRHPLKNLYSLCNVDEVDVLTKGCLLEKNVMSFKELDNLQDDFFHVIFDCTAELNKDHSKDLETKKKKTNCQYMTLSTAKVIIEKKARDENWQKEFNLLNGLIKKRKLTLNKFQNDNAIEYDANAIQEAYAAINNGEIIGKAVVEINDKAIESLKAKVVEAEGL